MTQKTVHTPPLQLINLALSHEKQKKYKEAYTCFQQAKVAHSALSNHLEKELLKTIDMGLWRLSPLWWADIRHGDITLRRCKKEDAAFFRHCYSNEQFMHQFNRTKPYQGDLEVALTQAGQLPPITTGLLMWVIQSSKRGSIGLASLSSIDSHNLKTELSIGFPHKAPATYAVKSTLLMLHYALIMMPFNKVYTYVYEDNPDALHNTLRLGFKHEGLLQAHFKLPDYGFVNVNITGMTKTQLKNNTFLKNLAKRSINQDW